MALSFRAAKRAETPYTRKQFFLGIFTHYRQDTYQKKKKRFTRDTRILVKKGPLFRHEI